MGFAVEKTEINPDMLAGIKALAPLTGDPQGGAIASMKSNYNIPEGPTRDFAEILKPAAPGRGAPKLGGME